MIHYHGTPITPVTALYELAGRHFCVSHAWPADVTRAHAIGQSVMLDNGAFSAWKSGKQTDWSAYYKWADPWLDYPTTWAVIPDVIEDDETAQDDLIREWPHGQKGAPVWHMHESLDRLANLTLDWPRVCIGSSAQYAVVLSDPWMARMDDAWECISNHHRRTPVVHMLRGMQLSGMRWPFASVDSTDVARNHNRDQNTPRKMADRWDCVQCQASFTSQPKQFELVARQTVTPHDFPPSRNRGIAGTG
jgi:hypothetical protein